MSGGIPAKALLLIGLPPLAALGLAFGLDRAVGQAETAARAAQTTLARALAEAPTAPDVQAGRLLVTGDTVGISASAFQAILLDKVQNAGLGVQQIDPHGATMDGALTRISATLRMQGTEAQVANAIIAIEASEPLVFIDRLQLAGDGTENGPIRAELDLSAFAGRMQP